MQTSTATNPTARKSGARQSRTTGKSTSLGKVPDNGKNQPVQTGDLDDQPEDSVEEPQEKSTEKEKLSERSAARESVPKNTRGTVPRGQKTWYKSDTAYDTKKTGPAAIPPEDALEVTRKRKVSSQPKPSPSGASTSQKRKKVAPSHWSPQTQPRTTYIMGDKAYPTWGLIHKGSMDPKENWQVPIYTQPKITDQQEAARKEAHKKKLKYKRYKPEQLALKEIRYYRDKKNVGFIIPISAIRRLCLEVG